MTLVFNYQIISLVDRTINALISIFNLFSRFYRKYHFPETIGCLDGTYIEIVRPRDDEEAFYDRKGHYSINAQFVRLFLPV